MSGAALMTTVGSIAAIVVLLALLGVFACGAWALRRQNQQFPPGFDRTGWSPEPGRASWLSTKFTWLSGGRG